MLAQWRKPESEPHALVNPARQQAIVFAHFHSRPQPKSATLLYIQMVLAWDESKNRINRLKHGVSFDTAARIFEDLNAISYLDRVVDDEQRWHTIGCAVGIALLLVVHTSEEQYGEEEIRIISARKASRRERALYEARH